MSKFTREELNLKSIRELLPIIKSLGIMGKNNKEQLISEILEKQESGFKTKAECYPPERLCNEGETYA